LGCGLTTEGTEDTEFGGFPFTVTSPASGQPKAGKMAVTQNQAKEFTKQRAADGHR